MAREEAYWEALSSLRGELRIDSVDDYERFRARTSEIEARIAALQTDNASVRETEEFRDLDNKRERAEQRVEILRQARTRLGPSPGSSDVLRDQLVLLGGDPNVALWRPDSVRSELARQVKHLSQAAGKYRLLSEHGLSAKTAESWLRVAQRMVGTQRPLPALRLSLDGRLILPGGSAALEELDQGTAIAVVQSLRLALLLTLVGTNAPGVFPFSVEVHSKRIADPKIRSRLQDLYEGVSDRLQVLVLDSIPG